MIVRYNILSTINVSLQAGAGEAVGIGDNHIARSGPEGGLHCRKEAKGNEGGGEE